MMIAMLWIFGKKRPARGQKNEKRIYLDYAAATPVRGEVLEAMQPYFSDIFANPSAIHEEGVRARKAVDDARSAVAAILKIRSEEITFTSGGTEANNLAIFGVVDAALAQEKRGMRQSGGLSQDLARDVRSEANGDLRQVDSVGTMDIEIISTAIEHPSVLEALAALETHGVKVHFVPVDREGRIDVSEFSTLLSPKTLLVTFAYVNSEIGVVQDVRRIVRAVRSAEKDEQRIWVHIDASQAPLWLPCAMDSLGVDLMTLDAGKCYGPKGVGVLAHKRQVPLQSHFFGGDQEGGLRPGTENVPLIIGFAKAFEIAQARHKERADKVGALRDFFFEELKRAIPETLINGSQTERVANNCNISSPGIDGEFAVVTLDVHGIAASTRSACAGGKGGGSHVVAAITGDQERANSTIRFTLGEETTKEDVLRTAEVLSKHAIEMQSAPSRNV